MSFRFRCVLRALGPLLLLCITLLDAMAAEASDKQYLIFQIFAGGPEGVNGEYHPDQDILKAARRVADAVRPQRNDPNRVLGFAVGPVAMDRGEGIKSFIRHAFDVALETNLAVMLHLDDYMFWEQARWPDGRVLHAVPGTIEWKDWSGTPAEPLNVGWLPNIKLAPQMCYESPEVKKFVAYWTGDVIGQEIKKQLDRLAQLGKPQIFAGVITGWESNLAHGYCSLSHLGYSAQNPPADFDHERERVLQRHIERWAKGINDAGIPKDMIFTHLGPIPRQQYEKMTAMLPRSRFREIPQSTAFRAFWTGFNPYSSPGFSAYMDDAERFRDIYDAVRTHGQGGWAMAEGTNVILRQGGAERSPVPWETYLARSFNHGARVVNIFGGFQGEAAGEFGRATESAEALAAYRKFLQGDHLVEDKQP